MPEQAMNRKDAEALVAEVEAAWNSHDIVRFAACFATDADFVNVAGAWWRGRAEIEERHAASHADMFKNSTMQGQLGSFKEIGPGIGVMHVAWPDESLRTGPCISDISGTPDPRNIAGLCGTRTVVMRLAGNLARFDPGPLHFFGRCANRRA